jgi:GGDEF domain-containing protein
VEHYNERHIPKIDIAIGMEKTNTDDPVSFDELFDLADKKMYENKKMEKCGS